MQAEKETRNRDKGVDESVDGDFETAGETCSCTISRRSTLSPVGVKKTLTMNLIDGRA